MNKKEKTILKLHDELCKINDDVERWKWVSENSDNVIIELDNNQTYITFIGDNENEYYVVFDEHTGNDIGICYLLEAIGINSRIV